MTTIKVFALDDIEWWAGESLEACVAEGRRQCGHDCYPDDPEIQREITDVELQRRKFVDDDGGEHTCAEELANMIASGDRFPCHFAATEW